MSDWRERALCLGSEPELWFPSEPADAVLPILICQECPVMRQCADLADRNGERFGVWGGKWLGIGADKTARWRRISEG